MQATLNPASPAREFVRAPQPQARNIAVDAYRGFVMLLMMAEVLRFSRVAQAFPGNWFWHILAYNQTHVEWAGCSLHDMIQPSFSFLVGVALPYSIASRIAKGGTFWKLFGARVVASLPAGGPGNLPALHGPPANQLHHGRHAHADWVWLSFPLPAGLPAAALGVGRAGCDPDGLLAGVGALSGGRAELRLAIRGRVRRLERAAQLHGLCRALEQELQFGERLRSVVPEPFPRAQRRGSYNDGGYLTLSFIPTLGTMILGLIAGTLAARGRAGDSHEDVCCRRRGGNRARASSSTSPASAPW